MAFPFSIGADTSTNFHLLAGWFDKCWKMSHRRADSERKEVVKAMRSTVCVAGSKCKTSGDLCGNAPFQADLGNNALPSPNATAASITRSSVGLCESSHTESSTIKSALESCFHIVADDDVLNLSWE